MLDLGDPSFGGMGILGADRAYLYHLKRFVPVIDHVDDIHLPLA
jgi:hypothetical protein